MNAKRLPRGPRNAGRGLDASDKIDICRGLFAFLVVVAHALEVTRSMLPDAGQPLGELGRRVLFGAAGSGIYWVMGFFVISGYCIQLSVQRLSSRGAFPLGNYLVARLSRILPLYYLALAFAVLVEWWIADYRPANWPNGLSRRILACQVLLIQNLTETYGSFSPSWSITNEAFYYVFYGLLVVGLARSRPGPIAVGLASCIGIGLAMDVVYHVLPRPRMALATSMLFGLGTNWFIGAWLAEHRDRLAASRGAQALARTWPVVLAVCIGIRCSYTRGGEVVFIGSGLAFALMLVRFFGADHERGGKPADDGTITTSRRVIRGLGLASYPTYLFHGPMIMIVGSLLIRSGTSLWWPWTWSLLAAAGIATGIAGGYLLEEPIMGWRSGVLRRLGSRPSTTPSCAGPITGPIAATRWDISRPLTSR